MQMRWTRQRETTAELGEKVRQAQAEWDAVRTRVESAQRVAVVLESQEWATACNLIIAPEAMRLSDVCANTAVVRADGLPNTTELATVKGRREGVLMLLNLRERHAAALRDLMQSAVEANQNLERQTVALDLAKKREQREQVA
jgi:hypothetical protein